MSAHVLLTATSWWPTSAHLAISLAGCGAEVAALYPAKGHPLASTRVVSQRFAYRPLSPLQSLERAIVSSGAQVILPCDDRALSHLHRLHARAAARGQQGAGLARTIEGSLGPARHFALLGSRAPLLRVAQQCGVPTPAMRQVQSVADLEDWASIQPFPWVMKVDGSWGGLGVRVVADLQEAQATLRAMHRPLQAIPTLKRLLVNRDAFWIDSWRRHETPAVTVQAFVKGFPANCVVFSVEGQVRAGIAVEVTSAQSSTGPATTVRLTSDPQMLHAAQTIAKRLELSGFHGFDFLIDEKTGIAQLIELNARCAMPSHLRVGPDRDLTGALYQELTGSKPRPVPPIQQPDVAYFPQAWLSDPDNPLLRNGLHDVPWSEPALVRELMRLPWPDRSLLARWSDRLRNMDYEQRSARRLVVQPSASTHPQLAPQPLHETEEELV